MAQANAGVQTGRTVYVGSLPPEAAVDELLSQVRFGPIENVKILPEKNCAFLSFIDPTTAAAFHSDALMRKIQLHGQELKIGWGKPSAVPAPVMMAVQQHGATRNVYLGNLDESFTEQSLRDDLSRFGPIDQVKIVRDKNIGFIHFLSIATAIKVVSTLATEPEWAGRRVNYGQSIASSTPIRLLTADPFVRQGSVRVRPKESTSATAAQHGGGSYGSHRSWLRGLQRRHQRGRPRSESGPTRKQDSIPRQHTPGDEP